MSCIQTASGMGRHPHHHSVPLVGAEARLRTVAWRYLAQTLLGWIGRSEQRHDLARLDEHLLRDIGVTRAEARREAAKPFWVD